MGKNRRWAIGNGENRVMGDGEKLKTLSGRGFCLSPITYLLTSTTSCTLFCATSSWTITINTPITRTSSRAWRLRHNYFLICYFNRGFVTPGMETVSSLFSHILFQQRIRHPGHGDRVIIIFSYPISTEDPSPRCLTPGSKVLLLVFLRKMGTMDNDKNKTLDPGVKHRDDGWGVSGTAPG